MQPNQPWSPYGQTPPSPQQSPYAQQGYGPIPNPYGAPMYRENGFAPPGASAGPLVSGALKKAKLGLGIVQVLAMVSGFALVIAGAAMQEDGHALALAGGGLLGLWYLLFFAYAIVNMVWIYQFWSWLPPDQRWTNMWKKYISPGTAIGFLFIPYFNLYWMFVVYLGIADIMERMRVQFPSSKPPAKTLALFSAIGPILFFPAAPFLQFFFSKRVEEMAAEMQSRMHAPRV